MVEIRNISLKLKNRILFDDFNLKIEHGEKVVFTADSGSGKTTIFRMLLGFQQPDTGEIQVNGHKLAPESIREIRSKISYVSQDIDLRKRTFREILDEIYSYEVNSKFKRDDEKIIKYLERFKLNADYLDKMIPELSGGERQRIGLIICCLLQRPIWLLDEPTSALDENMKNLVVQNVLDSKSTVLIISHEKHWLKDDRVKEVNW